MAQYVGEEVGDEVIGAALDFGGFTVFVDEFVGMGEEDELAASADGFPVESGSGQPIKGGRNAHEGADIGESEGGDGHFHDVRVATLEDVVWVGEVVFPWCGKPVELFQCSE